MLLVHRPVHTRLFVRRAASGGGDWPAPPAKSRTRTPTVRASASACDFVCFVFVVCILIYFLFGFQFCCVVANEIRVACSLPCTAVRSQSSELRRGSAGAAGYSIKSYSRTHTVRASAGAFAFVCIVFVRCLYFAILFLN